jgi:hypothetical protein
MARDPTHWAARCSERNVRADRGCGSSIAAASSAVRGTLVWAEPDINGQSRKLAQATAYRSGVRVLTGKVEEREGHEAVVSLDDGSTRRLQVPALTLHPGSYDWKFVPIGGGSFTDSGSGTCL